MQQKEGTGGERRPKDRVTLPITLLIQKTNNFFQYRRTRGLKTLENNKFPTTRPIFLLIKRSPPYTYPK